LKNSKYIVKLKIIVNIAVFIIMRKIYELIEQIGICIEIALTTTTRTSGRFHAQNEKPSVKEKI